MNFYNLLIIVSIGEFYLGVSKFLLIHIGFLYDYC